ncbi:MAG: hypothetical protein IPM18_10330 [Phycisphaerales bacterium]|nr:hypothetical protein [Phycisphaerales bacterium]
MRTDMQRSRLAVTRYPLYYRGMRTQIHVKDGVFGPSAPRFVSNAIRVAHRARYLSVGGLLILLAGCQAPLPPTSPTQRTLQIPDVPIFVDDAVSVLRQIDLLPEYVDRASGLIVTTPTTSGQWFEFWRVDAPGGYQALESSLHTIQRRVTVEVLARELSFGPPSVPDNFSTAAESQDAGRPAADHETDTPNTVFTVRVQVEKFRLSVPERQITTASGALRIFDEDTPTVRGDRGARSNARIWVPLGRDALLEEQLLERFARLPGITAVDSPTAVTSSANEQR